FSVVVSFQNGRVPGVPPGVPAGEGEPLPRPRTLSKELLAAAAKDAVEQQHNIKSKKPRSPAPKVP
ncbi:unnamed protein product, partial [Amoebophrya sp. A25]